MSSPNASSSGSSSSSSHPQYDVQRQGIDKRRVLLLFLKWPIYLFRLVRRGRFSTIAELRKDSYRLRGHVDGGDGGSRARRSNSEDFMKGLRSTLGSPRIAVSWAAVLGLVMAAEALVPRLSGLIAALITGASVTTILVALSSIARESSSSAQTVSEAVPTSIVFSLLTGAFFVASTFPFALPWVLAFFFPRQCLFFFAAWAIVGAITNEVTVLVSHASFEGGRELEHEIDNAMPAAAPGTAPEEKKATSLQHEGRPRPAVSSAAKRRSRKTTEQRIATVSNFTLDDRKDLEDFIVSDEGLKWWAAFLAMQAFVSGTAVFLRLLSDMYFANTYLVAVSILISICFLCESFWMTYAAGGRWLHFRRKWRFFQPLSGGQKFIAMQSLSWTFFFTFLLLSGSELRDPLRKAMQDLDSPEWGVHFVDTVILARLQRMCALMGLNRVPSQGWVALYGAVAELLMLVSLPLFEGPIDSTYLVSEREMAKEKVLDSIIEDIVQGDVDVNTAAAHATQVAKAAGVALDPSIKEAVARLKQKRRPLRSAFSVPVWEIAADALRTAWLAPIVLTLTKPEVTVFLTGFVMTKLVHGQSFFGLFTIQLPWVFLIAELLYLPTFFGNPRRSGHRRWWSIRGSWIYDELMAYWYANIIRKEELNPNHKHIFGYAPHGMFPMGASYLHNTTQWMDLFPSIVPYSLTATVTHIVPLLREITQYNGGIEVTQDSFSNALEKFRNVLLVPGGQHEMLLFSDDPAEVPISCKHKGFVRLALISAAEHPEVPTNLVPIFNFGEPDMLWNGFPASVSLQRWLVAKLRLNPAFLPMGRFNLAGVPRRVQITFVVGAPVRVPVVGGIPTEEQVDLLARRYYTAVKETFDEHKELCDGFEDASVAFVPALDTVSKDEFDAKWKEVEKQSDGPLSSLKRKRDPAPIAEYMIAIILFNVCLWAPYVFFATS